MSAMRKIYLTIPLMVFILASPIAAQEEQADEAGVKTGTTLTLQLSSLPEAKLIFNQSFAVPFFQGDNGLTRGNNIKFNVGAEVTPISMSFLGKVVLTPIAFLEFSMGGLVGSGWNIELFGSEVRGLGKNVPKFDSKTSTNKTSVDGSAFDGTFLEADFGGTFQFDLAAVVPGDWNHIVMQVYQEANIKTYSRAAPNEPWFCESDHGENQNGWNYLASYTVGYQMPIFLNMVALQAEMKKYLFNNPESSSWGGNLGRWDFGFIMNFKMAEKWSGMLVTQFRLYRNYENFTYGNNDDTDPDYNRYYRDRILDDGMTLKFYRVAAIITHRIK